MTFNGKKQNEHRQISNSVYMSIMDNFLTGEEEARSDADVLSIDGFCRSGHDDEILPVSKLSLGDFEERGRRQTF